jgi:hypothetical protein
MSRDPGGGRDLGIVLLIALLIGGAAVVLVVMGRTLGWW